MLEAEAARVCEILLRRGGASPLLNLGSSTARHREIVAPHIERALFAPLRRAGIEVVHCDLKTGEGVDVAGDVLDRATRARLAAAGFRSLLAANLLEHVRDRAAVAAACEAIVGPGGAILATVPRSYPYHADPLDSGWRPGPDEHAALFAGSRVLLAEEIAGPTYAEAIAAAGGSVGSELARTLGALLALRPRSFASRLHRWAWYRRRYRVSLALVEVA